MLIARVERLCESRALANFITNDSAVRATVDSSKLILRLRDQNRVALTLNDLKRSLSLVQRWLGSDAGCLTWFFSNVSVDCGALPRLTSRWEDTAEPPVLDIIGLNLDTAVTNGTHHTRGLGAFVGHEVAAHYRRHEQCEDAARALARFARQILMNGTVPKTISRVALDDCYFGLTHSKLADARNVIATIKL